VLPELKHIAKKENKKATFNNIEIAELRQKSLTMLQAQDQEIDFVQKVSDARKRKA
jgi:hypothetical protein